MTKNSENKTVYSGSGGRKASVARVHLTNSTTGESLITVNGMDPIKFFHRELLVRDMIQPLKVTETLGKYDVKILVNGGGKTGQAGAARLAIAKTLLKISEEYKKDLRDNDLLTRDARVKERKKYGLKAARKAPQFSKR